MGRSPLDGRDLGAVLARYLYTLKYAEKDPIIELAASILGVPKRTECIEEAFTMLKLSNLSLLTLAGAILVLLCQAVSSLVYSDTGWVNWHLIDFVDAGHLAWVDGVSILNVNSVINYMLNMPLSGLLFCLTAVLFSGSLIRNRNR